MVTPIPPTARPAQRLLSIDMLRGIAALSVVVHHAVMGAREPTTQAGLAIHLLAGLGRLSVWLFFVISGFCIHLRWASGSGTQMPEVIPFWRRRIVRLYPTYFSVLVIAVASGVIESGRITAGLGYNVAMHMLMLHNLDGRIIFSFIGPFWTLALEEQLYLAYFPLLWIRRRWGWGVALALCFLARPATYVVGSLLHHRVGITLPLQAFVTSQWFVWALGALAVEGYLGRVRLPAWSRSGILAFALLLLAGGSSIWDDLHPGGRLSHVHWLLIDPVLGLAFFLVVNFVLSRETKKLGAMGRAATWMAALGGFSYSLYLTHPLWTQHWLPRILRSMSIQPQLSIMLATIPGMVLFAWLYFQVLERPFIALARKPLPSFRD